MADRLRARLAQLFCANEITSSTTTPLEDPVDNGWVVGLHALQAKELGVINTGAWAIGEEWSQREVGSVEEAGQPFTASGSQ